MQIQIGFDSETMIHTVKGLEKELSLSKEEKKAIEIILNFLSSSVDVSEIITERRSSNYISLIYRDNDFLRLKYSTRAKWISLRLPNSILKNNIGNPLFSAQKNKRQFHWKAAISSFDDLESLKPFIIASCVGASPV